MSRDLLSDHRGRITGADTDAVAAVRARSAAQAKPPGSLGRLEDLGARLAGIAGRCPPPVPTAPALVIMAGDHGVHAAGVTPWPQDVTALMVANFCTGGAAANALADTVGASVTVVDVGVAGDLPAAVHDHARLRSRRVRAGTRNLAVADAMTAAEVEQAVVVGAEVVDERLDDGADLVVLGDMGIANTTPSAALVAATTGSEPAAVTGRGTGIDDDLLAHKATVVADAVARVGDRPPLGLLAGLGGFEHAAMVGAMVAAAARRVPVVLDGVITNAAALVVVAWCPPVAHVLVAGHHSVEPGATVALDHLGLQPLLDLDLRLGEGTGGLLAVPIVQAAAAALSSMTLLDDLLG